MRATTLMLTSICWVVLQIAGGLVTAAQAQAGPQLRAEPLLPWRLQAEQVQRRQGMLAQYPAGGRPRAQLPQARGDIAAGQAGWRRDPRRWEAWADRAQEEAWRQQQGYGQQGYVGTPAFMAPPASYPPPDYSQQLPSGFSPGYELPPVASAIETPDPGSSAEIDDEPR